MADPFGLAALPPHVRAADFGHVLVLVDYRTGRVQGLLPAAAECFRKAARTGRSDLLPSRLAAHLLTSGLLRPSPVAGPWPVVRAFTASASWGSAEHPAGAARPAPVAPGMLLGATAALIAVAAVKAGGDRRTAMLRLVRSVHRAGSTSRRPATLEQAVEAVLAVRFAGWHSPARTACLEESGAAVLLLAARRLGVTWCHGVAADPVRLHAWVQTEDGTPVEEPSSTGVYTPLLTLGAHHQRQS